MIRPVLLPFVPLLIFVNAPAFAQSSAGPRVELNLGYDRLQTNDDFPNLPQKLEGARIGGALGYDAAIGQRLLLGVEGGAGWTLGAKTTTGIAADRVSEDLGRDLDVSARAGLRLSPRTVAFAKVGYANSRFVATYDGAVAGGFERERFATSRGGLRLGAGLEQSLSGQVYAKGEYRWTHYSDGYGYVRSPVRHQLVFGVGTRF